MKIQIISSTDGQFLGKIFDLKFPIALAEGNVFMPDGEPIKIGGKILRYFNSNYSIDVQEYVEQPMSVESIVINNTD